MITKDKVKDLRKEANEMKRTNAINEVRASKVVNPILEELKAYYQCTHKVQGKKIVKYNKEYGIEYSQKAVEFLELHKDDMDLDDSLRDARIYYGDSAIGYHEMISYYVYEAPRAEHVRLCRCCGRAFNYEHLIKPVNLRTGLLSIPVKCPVCSNSKNY